MREHESGKCGTAGVTDLATFEQLAARQIWTENSRQLERFKTYRLALGQETIQLGIVEFRILLYLAGRPYHAFTRRSIADAVSSERDPVVEDTVDWHVASLLKQLGIYHDFVQAVPHIGYRYKA